MCELRPAVLKSTALKVITVAAKELHMFSFDF